MPRRRVTTPKTYLQATLRRQNKPSERTEGIRKEQFTVIPYVDEELQESNTYLSTEGSEAGTGQAKDYGWHIGGGMFFWI